MTQDNLILVAVETAHIQQYIFNSNRLKENVGASYLVAAATDEWALQTLRDMRIRTNLEHDRDEFQEHRHIEGHDLDVEVLYSGGGKIVMVFSETAFAPDAVSEYHLPEDALSRQFIRALSRRIQREAPGLELTFSVKPFSWDQSLSAAVGDLLGMMKQQSSYQPALLGEAGLGVQIMGASTSMPAVAMRKDPNGNWQSYSAETIARLDAVDDANKLLDDRLNRRNDYTFPLELDDLGRSKGDTSYIAVVHADGNGLGVLIQGLQVKFPAAKNRAYIDYMRAFSQGVKEVATAAQRDMIDLLVDSIEEDADTRKQYLRGIGRKTEPIELKRRGDRFILPIRPLVSGGDDVTFVCDGRIGLDLAVMFLEKFEQYTHEILGKQLAELGVDGLTACAGVAIVKTHYPFARAYDLAEDLARNAKQARHFWNKDTAPSAIDWHVTAGGLYGNLDTMREREYQLNEYDYLTLRPLFVTDVDVDHPLYLRSWQMMQRTLTDFQRDWQKHQNKAEGLREALRKGTEETVLFKLRYLSDTNSPRLPQFDGFEVTGWQEIDGENYCGYYDALELLDKYIPLKTATEEAIT